MNNKICLITGATSGIGRGLVDSLLSTGWNVYGIGRDEKKVADLKYNDRFQFINFDVRNVDDYQKLFQDNFVDVQFSGFAHCAGKEETIPLSLYEPEKIKEIYIINVFSAIEFIRLLSKKKYSADGASFLLVSSVMSELGQPGKVGYCSTKAALLGIIKSAALELSKRRIRVNGIAPGIVKTPLTKAMADKIGEEAMTTIEKLHPLGFGEVGDIVPLMAFLLSNDSRWITGQNIKVDGGYSIQ